MGRRLVEAGLCTVLASLACPLQALADGERRLQISTDLDIQYDSNVARSDAALAALRGIKQEDEIYTPSIVLDIVEPISRQDVFLKGSAGYDFYANNHVLNNGRIDLQGGVDANIRDCKGTFAADYARNQSDLEELSLIATRNVEQNSSVSLDATCGGAIGIVPTASVSEHRSSNSASKLFTSDYNLLSASAGVAYRRPNFGELSLLGTYDQTDYPNRDLLVGPASIQDGYKLYGVALRFDRHLGARIEGSVKLAYDFLRPDAQSLAGFQGLTYGADISVRLSSRLQARLTFDRGAIPVNRPDVTYALETSYTGEAIYTVTPRLHLKLGASERSDRYRGAALVSGLDIASEDLWDGYGSVRYEFGRRFSIQLDGRYENRDANIRAFSYKDERVELTLGARI